MTTDEMHELVETLWKAAPMEAKQIVVNESLNQSGYTGPVSAQVVADLLAKVQHASFIHGAVTAFAAAGIVAEPPNATPQVIQ